jgi:AcrR family transcriptional regulator
MPTPARILQATVDGLPNHRRRFSEKQRERQEYILTAALAVFARHGRAGLSMGAFGLALGMSPAAIRRLFVDLDTILAELLVRHLFAILRALTDIPADTPNRNTALRAAYLAATRTAEGRLTEPHILLLRERHSLPPDLATDIEATRDSIGEILAGADGAAALALLDTPGLAPSRIETMLAALDPKPEPIPKAAVTETNGWPSFPAPRSASRQDLLASASIARTPEPRGASP